MSDLERRVAKAVRHFWQVRNRQSQAQGVKTGQRDSGFRTAVTGGKHLDGFVSLCSDLLIEAGVPETQIHTRRRLELPGYYRAEKCWDLLAAVDDQLIAVVEFKAQVGPSFGNNFNNRTEEAIGSATDLWAAYREGAFRPSSRPWLGYMFLLEDCPKSQSPVSVKAPHFPVFEEFQAASYAKRYEVLLTKLLRERLYDGSCLLLSESKAGLRGKFQDATPELAFATFAASLKAHAMASTNRI